MAKFIGLFGRVRRDSLTTALLPAVTAARLVCPLGRGGRLGAGEGV
jgi:hypothetical protein